MNRKRVLVTGAGGFVGRYVVNILISKGYQVVAGLHQISSAPQFIKSENLTQRIIDINNSNSLVSAMEGVDSVYHFAALVNSHSSREDLNSIHIEGTKKVWECAGKCGIKKALYCSSTAVYGLLGQNGQAITENTPPRAIEPYGNSKLQGEQIALALGKKYHIKTFIIRPTAIFGPGEHTPFGNKLRDAMISKVLIAGSFKKKKFNYVHVEDVAEAAVYIMESQFPSGEIFNIMVNTPILYEDAFRTYTKILKRLGEPYSSYKKAAYISSLFQKIPFLTYLGSWIAGKHFFTVYQPGFDLYYSSEKLLKTSFRFKHTDFEEVLYSCSGEYQKTMSQK